MKIAITYVLARSRPHSDSCTHRQCVLLIITNYLHALTHTRVCTFCALSLTIIMVIHVDFVRARCNSIFHLIFNGVKLHCEI